MKQPYEYERNRRLLVEVSEWWDSDRNRLFTIRFIAYGLFLGSIAGTIYAGVKGALPIWAVTVYVFFAVQLVFLTFMYAIRHSGRAEIRRAPQFDLRTKRQAQWEFERGLLAEFTRVSACLAAGMSPDPAVVRAKRGDHLVVQKLPLPSIENRNQVARELMRDALAPYLAESPAHKPIDNSEGQVPTTSIPATKRIDLEFIAYSSETLIELSREMTAELDDQLGDADGKLDDVDFYVRVLIRDTTPDHDWLIPLTRHEQADEEYAADLRTRFRNVQRSELRRFEEALKNLTSPGQVHFSVRGYWTEPLIKGIMVNQTRGMFGIYTVSELQDPPGWDYSGHDIEFCVADMQGNAFQKAAAGSFNEWFRLMWEERNSGAVER